MTLSTIAKSIGYVWALPVTLFGLAYMATFAALGWYRYYYTRDFAHVFVTNNARMPGWLAGLWKGWGGHTIGAAMVLCCTPESGLMGRRLFAHERHHVEQCMKYGPFQPFFYLAAGCLAAMAGLNFYRDNVFEVAAYDVGDKAE